MDEEHGPTDCGGTLEQESFSHNKRPPGAKNVIFPALSGGLWPMLSKSATHLPWLNGRTWKNWGISIPICVFTAVHLGKDLEDFTANRCAILRQDLVFVACCQKSTWNGILMIFRGWIAESLERQFLKSTSPYAGVVSYCVTTSRLLNIFDSLSPNQKMNIALLLNIYIQTYIYM